MSLALYRRYRPETFAEVIGQEHVTEPLQQAIRNDRVHHAYLFSGPRGCGKTTSARLLARCLNCEKGPTPQPCGECQSCRDLARGGAGGLDVVEIDAASHGGVDDARDLRERAFFAPAASRFKVYIIDEAHMVTTAGFNALLKVVEEPPPHLKFIFATTEPDKVIGTIRSRTHHYPFRLVPPSVLRTYLGELCEREGVAVEAGVLPLVVRAGAGSVRDALSVLDQLIAGAGDDGVTYRLATSLLGFTDGQLLDDTLDAFAAHDGAGVFSVIERVIEGGHDPRRFAQDLLERLRDLVILAAVADAETRGLIDVPADQLDRMRQQADGLGPAELTRAADIVNTGLTEMRGATAPRLQLELICARIILPGAYGDEQALAARLERVERRLSLGEAAEPAPARTAEPPTATEQPGQSVAKERTGTEEPASPQPARAEPARPEPPKQTPAASSHIEPAAASAVTAAPAGLDLAGVRRVWPDILDMVKAERRYSWMILSDHVHIAGLGDGVITLAFANEGQRKNFASSGSDEILRKAIVAVLGGQWRIDAVLDPQAAAGPKPTGKPTGPASDPPARGGGGDQSAARPRSATGRRTAQGPAQVPRQPTSDKRPASPDAHATPDDPNIEQSGLAGADLVAQELGATVIDEYDHGA